MTWFARMNSPMTVAREEMIEWVFVLLLLFEEEEEEEVRRRVRTERSWQRVPRRMER